MKVICSKYRSHIKWFCLLFLVISIGLGVISCSGKNSTPTQKAVTLRFSFWGTPEEVAITKELISRFEAKYPGIKIKPEHVAQQYLTKLLTEFAGKAGPDIVFIERSDFPYFGKNDVLLDLDPYIEKEKDFPKNDFQPNIVKAFEYENKTYGIPRDMGAMVLFYNKRLFKQAGLSYPDKITPWDWNKFLEVSKKLTKVNKDGKTEQYGIILNSWMWDIWAFQNGGKPMAEDGSKCLMDSTAVIEALQFMVDLSLKHHVAPTPRESANKGMTLADLFEMQKVAMYPTGFWMVAEFKKYKDLDYDVAPLPKGKVQASSWHGSAYAISKQTQYPEEAWKFLNFSTSTEVQIMMAKSGLLIPSRRSVSNSDALLKAPGMPEHVHAFLDAIDIADAVPVVPLVPDANMIIAQNMDLAYNGDKPVADVCKYISSEINKKIMDASKKK